MMKTIALAFMLVAALTPVRAQGIRTLVIENGRVSVDGRTLESTSLPDSFDVSGINARFSFVSDEEPLFGFRGRAYKLTPDRLVEVPFNSPSPMRVGFPGNQAMNAFTASMAEPPSDPRMEYLNLVQERDAFLYEMLMNEARKENETLLLARQIRNLEDARDRDSLTTVLYNRVEEAFELKQETRRREIEQIEASLKELKGSLRAREKRRDQIIHRRVDDLIGTQRH